MIDFLAYVYERHVTRWYPATTAKQPREVSDRDNVAANTQQSQDSMYNISSTGPKHAAANDYQSTARFILAYSPRWQGSRLGSTGAGVNQKVSEPGQHFETHFRGFIVGWSSFGGGLIALKAGSAGGSVVCERIRSRWSR